jgi:hypothetical protein
MTHFEVHQLQMKVRVLETRLEALTQFLLVVAEKGKEMTDSEILNRLKEIGKMPEKKEPAKPPSNWLRCLSTYAVPGTGVSTRCVSNRGHADTIQHTDGIRYWDSDNPGAAPFFCECSCHNNMAVGIDCPTWCSCREKTRSLVKQVSEEELRTAKTDIVSAIRTPQVDNPPNWESRARAFLSSIGSQWTDQWLQEQAVAFMKEAYEKGLRDGAKKEQQAGGFE